MSNPSKKIRQFKLSHCYLDYEDKAATWRDIETKARGMLALCSALLLAILFLVTNLNALDSAILFILIISALPLLHSILYCSWSLLVQDFDGIEDAESLIHKCDLLLSMESKEKQAEEFERLLDRHSDSWALRCAGLSALNDKKAKYLTIAEKGLFVAIALLVISLLIYLGANIGSQNVFG